MAEADRTAAETKIGIVVVLATRDGAAVLPRVLDGYVGAQLPEAPWRLVVVDNGSGDATPAVLASYRTRLPLTVLTEPSPGKNRALNRAVAAVLADGPPPDLWIFTDDDAVPDGGFLPAWERAAMAHPGHALFGGTVRPLFEQPPPAWLCAGAGHFPELYALNLRGEGDIPARAIFGPNMAVRGAVMAAGHRFDTGIGPNGRPDYAMGSETEFCVRIAAATGARSWFAPDPAVGHIVRPWQMTPGFVAARAYRHGRGFARQQDRAGAGPPGRKSRLAAVVRSVGYGLALKALPDAGPLAAPRFEALWRHHWWRGVAAEYADVVAGQGVPADQGVGIDPSP